MKERKMVMIGGGNTIRISEMDCTDFHADDYHESHRPELVSQTEVGYQGYVSKHGGQLIYPTLAGYPASVD